MEGRRVVAVLVVGVAVLAGAIWSAGGVLTGMIDAQAESEGVPRLTTEEAAVRTAREDRFGLPSRLEHPPEREIERHRKIGTAAAPLSADAEGASMLVDVYAVTVELCGKRAKTGADEPVTLRLQVQDTHVVHVESPGHEGPAWDELARCLEGGLRPAVFAGDGVLDVTVELP